jgi:uncharacterized membrane protein
VWHMVLVPRADWRLIPITTVLAILVEAWTALVPSRAIRLLGARGARPLPVSQMAYMCMTRSKKAAATRDSK